MMVVASEEGMAKGPRIRNEKQVNNAKIYKTSGEGMQPAERRRGEWRRDEAPLRLSGG